MRRLAPTVQTVLLGPDPADYAQQLQDARVFDSLAITVEDAERAAQYRSEGERKQLAASTTDMNAYLDALEMIAEINPFTSVDAARIAQLTNKTNQFNLTTFRRTESEVRLLQTSVRHRCFTIRLRDRFGDHGLIAVVVAALEPAGSQTELVIDTWLMSCRVLNRQVEAAHPESLVRDRSH